MRLLLAFAALLSWTAGGLFSSVSYRSQFPPPPEIHVPADGASGDMLALAFGARRLFADVWFIRLMQYYGTPELEEGEQAGEYDWLVPGPKSEAEHERHEAAMNGEGRYPEFLPRSLHILQIDPFFTAAGLYSATALAFNMNRPSEAEELLRYGLRYSPREWKYLKVLAAVGYSRSSDPAAVAASIAPLLKDPDCPVMLKQLAAFLNKRSGNVAAAAAIYADIAATSRDPSYVRNAERELRLLAAGRPGR
ncbi:MAG: hypothetical protein M0011_00610 [Elusimicrobia bacterium]|nr:hypothetical protein [Elusimicrobiota bacterium]